MKGQVSAYVFSLDPEQPIVTLGFSAICIGYFKIA
jgi:hypothetical protein